MARGKKKRAGGKSAAKIAAQVNAGLKKDLEQMPEIKKRLTGGRPSEIHGKLGKSEHRHLRRNIKRDLKQGKHDDL